VSDPIVIAGDVLNEDAVPGRADAADLPDANRKSPERSIQAGPVSPTVQGRAGTRRQMKASRLVGAFSAQQTGLANIPGAYQPDAGERYCSVCNQPIDDLRQDAIDRSFGCDRQRNRLKGFWVHSGNIQRILGR
jgi:hypothetical protein